MENLEVEENKNQQNVLNFDDQIIEDDVLEIGKKNNNCGYFIDRSCFSLKTYSIECPTNPRIEIRAVWSRICNLVFFLQK